nr:hypothetical protein [Lysinibacillus timonensis]
MKKCLHCYQHPCKCERTVPENPIDLFGSPFECQKQIRTKRFASPNSPLPADELEDLQACIEAANDLLRSLGNESDPDNTRQLQLHFLNLKGIGVKVSILCGLDDPDNEEEFENENILKHSVEDIIENEKPPRKKRVNRKRSNRNRQDDFKRKTDNVDIEKLSPIKLITKTGKLANAGRDFIQINPTGSALFVSYSQLLSIARHECSEEGREPRFLNADQELRRELAFNFGQFVSKNKELENLFFGIPLYKALKKYIGEDVKVKTANRLICGTLIDSDEGRIQIQNTKHRIEIDNREICFIQILDLK